MPEVYPVHETTIAITDDPGAAHKKDVVTLANVEARYRPAGTEKYELQER